MRDISDNARNRKANHKEDKEKWKMKQLEQATNERLCSEVHYNVYIEDLELYTDMRQKPNKEIYTFIFVNERGTALSKEELEACKAIFDETLKNYEFSYCTLFSPFETPHY